MPAAGVGLLPPEAAAPAAPAEVQAVAAVPAAAAASAAVAAGAPAAPAVVPGAGPRPGEDAPQDSSGDRQLTTVPEAKPAPTAAAAPVAAPAMPVAMPVVRPAGEVAQSKARGREVEVEATPADADPPALRHVAATPAAPGPTAPAASPPPMAGAGDGAGQGLVLHEAGPAPWHLTADPAAAPGRAGQPLPPQPVQPQAIVGQVAVAIGKASDRRVEIRLDPPELGRVQIHLTTTDGGLQAVVLADRPETQDLLRRHAEVLARELGAAGYDSVSLDFAAGGDAAPGREGAFAAAPRAPDWAQVAPAAVTPETLVAAPRRGAAGGLDVRL